MIFLRKARTLFALAAAGDWSIVRRQLRLNRGRLRLRLRGPAPFVHHDLGFPAVCHPGWPDSAEQFVARLADTWEYATIRKWLRQGDCALDLGANLGLYTFAMLDAVGPTGHVLAVDADSIAIGRLGHATRLLNASNVTALHAAITDAEGEVTFYVRVDQTTTFMQSLRPQASQATGYKTVTVPARALTSLQREHVALQNVQLIKIDIEGAEVAALGGTPAAWLTADGPLWQIEINQEALARFQAHPREVLRAFPAHAFELWLLCKLPHATNRRPFLRRVRPDETFDDSVYYNLFAVPLGAAKRTRRTALNNWFSRSASAAEV